MTEATVAAVEEDRVILNSSYETHFCSIPMGSPPAKQCAPWGCAGRT